MPAYDITYIFVMVNMNINRTNTPQKKLKQDVICLRRHILGEKDIKYLSYNNLGIYFRKENNEVVSSINPQLYPKRLLIDDNGNNLEWKLIYRKLRL